MILAVFVHSAVDSFLKHYEKAGVRFPKTNKIEKVQSMIFRFDGDCFCSGRFT